MLNSGLHIGWGIWRIVFPGLSVDFGIFTFILMTWAIGAFFGGFIGSILTSIYRKDVSYVSLKLHLFILISYSIIFLVYFSRNYVFWQFIVYYLG